MMPRIFLVCSIWMAVSTASDNHPMAIRHRAVSTEPRHLQSPANENYRFLIPRGVDAPPTPTPVPTPAPTLATTPTKDPWSKSIFDIVTRIIGYFVSNIGQILPALDHAVEDLGNNTKQHVDNGS